MEIPTLVVLSGCILFVLSHFFNSISSRLKIPSVIFLILTGIASRIILNKLGTQISVTFHILSALGMLGLIVIVLEGSLDLKWEPKKEKSFLRSFMIALLLFAFSAAGIAYVIHLLNGSSWLNSLAYAIPLSIISSAIVIPSVRSIRRDKKELLIHESIFSDIIGVFTFNAVTSGILFKKYGLLQLGASLFLTVLLSLIISVLLAYIISRTRERVKTLFLLSLLIMIYLTAEMFHLSALLMIMSFGILMVNLPRLLTMIAGTRVLHLLRIEPKYVKATLSDLTVVNAEMSFGLRTLFFFLFGYSMNLSALTDMRVHISGAVIVAVIFVFRAVYLKFHLGTGIFPSALVAPRGLITLVLFYSIPQSMMIPKFGEGVITWVILATSLIMMVTLLLRPSDKKISLGQT